MTRHRGFSLIELVSVIVLLSVLTVSIAPRFTSRDGFAEYAARDQLVSAFRTAQQRAMVDHSGNCYRLNIDTTPGGEGFGPQREGAYFGPVGKIAFSGDYSNVSVTPALAIYFDGLGNTFLDGCGVNPLVGSTVLAIQPAGIQVQIFSSGYIKVI